MTKRFIAFALVMVAGIVLAGCGSGRPELLLDDARLQPVPENSPNYVIGPGDQIQVNVWNNREVSASVPVRPDGRISTPLVEDLVAVGKTPAQLADDIESVLSEYIRSPKVTIIVTNFQDTQGKIRVIGQATSPSAILFRERMTVLDVMIEVGGLAEFAAGNRARIIRKNSEGKEAELRVRLDDLINKGKIEENVLMQPGDILIIPESRF